MSLKKKFPDHKYPFRFTHNAEQVRDLPHYAHFHYPIYYEGDSVHVSLLLPASISMRQAIEERIAAATAKTNADEAAAAQATQQELVEEDRKPLNFERARLSAQEKELVKAKSALDQKEADQVLERTLHSEKAEC